MSHQCAKRLYEAIALRDLEEIPTLIREGVNVNTFDGKDKTPLHKACEPSNFYWPIVKLLLKNKANINAVDKHGCTPAMNFFIANFMDMKEGHFDLILDFSIRKNYLTQILKYSNINVTTECGYNILQLSDTLQLIESVLAHIAILKCTNNLI